MAVEGKRRVHVLCGAIHDGSQNLHWSPRILLQLTNARHELATAGLLANLHTKRGDLAEQRSRQSAPTNEQLESLQRSIAQPRPYRFVIEPAAK